jgi:hypothetical protein
MKRTKCRGGGASTEDGASGAVEGVVGEVALLPLGAIARIEVVQRLPTSINQSLENHKDVA